MILGLNLIPEAPVGHIVELAVQAERTGFDRCWVYDEGLVTRDVWVTLSAIAAVTDRLELGPGITNPYTRHPAQTASAVATLDELSGGRAFLGLGAGGSLTLDPLALARHRPLTAVGETIEATRALFTGTPTTMEGEHLQLRSAVLDYARPDLPIWLAGRGPRILALGGAAADGVMLDFIHRDTLAAQVARIRKAAHDAGRTVQLCYSTMVVFEPSHLEVVRPHMTYRLVDAPAEVRAAIGLGEDDRSRIRAAMAGGLAAAAEHVRDEWVLPFVVHGSESECAEQIGRLAADHGFDEFLLPIFEMHDPAGYLRRVAGLLGR